MTHHRRADTPRTLTLGHAIITTPRDVRKALLQGKLAGTAAEQQLQQLGEGYADDQIELGIGFTVRWCVML